MSLSATDLGEIRQIVEEVVQPIKGEIQALRNDAEEIYTRLDKKASQSSVNKLAAIVRGLQNEMRFIKKSLA